jgi:cytosine/adenosine deaminase-related metal-dependent hydrolase
MRVLGSSAELMPAVVRYVEAKALLGGVTTTQGIALFSNNGARRYYRGLVRNVESTADPDLPDALTRIADVDASDAASFLARLKKASCLLLHLSEGTNLAAHKHFEALHVAGDEWAVARSLAGIHCVALQAPDFDVLAARGASMIWSPFSNLLLYGQTANVKAAGVTIGIGSDWAPSGNKNVLGELKVAHLEAQRQGLDWSARDIVALATLNAAKILRWDTMLGSLEAGKKADVLVIESSAGDPYEALLRSSETSIVLVVINGVPRLGLGALMTTKRDAGRRSPAGRSSRACSRWR